LLSGAARQAGLEAHEAEDAVQETWVALARKMPEFQYEPGKDSFKGWLLQIARWKITDQFRKRKVGLRNQPIREDAPNLETGGPDSESQAGALLMGGAQSFDAIWELEWQRHLLHTALHRVKRRVRPEQYAIYHLHVVEEHPAAEVRRALNVSMAQVYLAKHRVGAAVRKELQRLRESR
jgi:RNA polymerase sigma factor (sigma-70 family)